VFIRESPQFHELIAAQLPHELFPWLARAAALGPRMSASAGLRGALELATPGCSACGQRVQRRAESSSLFGAELRDVVRRDGPGGQALGRIGSAPHARLRVGGTRVCPLAWRLPGSAGYLLAARRSP
jgi:hypothetical protein